MKRLLIPLLFPAVALAQQPALTLQQILTPAVSSWPTYNGDYSGRRFSALTRITDKNVRHLSLAWMYDLSGGGTLKATDGRNVAMWIDKVASGTQATAADLGLAGETGAAGARQEITAVVAAEARAAGEKHVDEGDGADKIVGFLESIKVL